MTLETEYNYINIIAYFISSGVPIIISGFVLYCLYKIMKSLKSLAVAHKELVEITKNKK